MMTMIPHPPGRASRGLRVARITYCVLALWAAVIAQYGTSGPYWEGAERWIVGGVVIVACMFAAGYPTAELTRAAAAVVAGFGVWRAGTVQLTDLPAASKIVGSATYITVAVLGLAVGTLTAGLAGLGGHFSEDQERA